MLLVSAAEKFNTAVHSLLPGTDYYPVLTVGGVGEARRRRVGKRAVAEEIISGGEN